VEPLEIKDQSNLKTETDFMRTRPLLILVGLTGTGKTTTVTALRQAGLDFLLLPNRRELTDRFIIQYLQEMDGEPLVPVQDRAERFAYTRSYRELHPGGMAEALFQYSVFSVQCSVSDHRLLSSDYRLPNTDYRILVFDGLRGENEVTHATRLLPEARFLFLHASDFVRVQRLLQRRDAFDAVHVNGVVDTAVIRKLAADILTNAETEQLLEQVHEGEICPEELQAKLTIVSLERQNYDPDATLSALQNLAPQRLIFANTMTHSPQEISEQTCAVVRNQLHIRQ
jgi:hypothetical protein